jgi:hypothetical protein
MSESVGKTIRFPSDLLVAIQKCADARDISFSEVVVETCEAKYIEHSIAYRVANLEQEVTEIRSRLESADDYARDQLDRN